MCEINEKFVSHLFLTYKKASGIWKVCDLWLVLSFVYHNKTPTHFCQFEHLGMNKKCNKV